jgi:hypothetical protein
MLAHRHVEKRRQAGEKAREKQNRDEVKHRSSPAVSVLKRSRFDFDPQSVETAGKVARRLREGPSGMG